MRKCCRDLSSVDQSGDNKPVGANRMAFPRDSRNTDSPSTAEKIEQPQGCDISKGVIFLIGYCVSLSFSFQKMYLVSYATNCFERNTQCIYFKKQKIF